MSQAFLLPIYCNSLLDPFKLKVQTHKKRYQGTKTPSCLIVITNCFHILGVLLQSLKSFRSVKKSTLHRRECSAIANQKCQEGATLVNLSKVSSEHKNVIQFNYSINHVLNKREI